MTSFFKQGENGEERRKGRNVNLIKFYTYLFSGFYGGCLSNDGLCLGLRTVQCLHFRTFRRNILSPSSGWVVYSSECWIDTDQEKCRLGYVGRSEGQRQSQSDVTIDGQVGRQSISQSLVPVSSLSGGSGSDFSPKMQYCCLSIWGACGAVHCRKSLSLSVVPICARAHTHTHIHTYIHTYIPTYIRTYVRTYVRTYTHTHRTSATSLECNYIISWEWRQGRWPKHELRTYAVVRSRTFHHTKFKFVRN
jgi:hypothetical protein